MRVLTISVLAIIPTILASIEHIFICKNEKNKISKKTTFLFYFVMFLVMEIALKLVKREFKLTLVQSFSEMGLQTYLHYGLPFIVLAIVLPFLLKILIAKGIRNCFFNRFISSFVTISLLWYMIFDNIINIAFMVIVIVSIVISLLSCKKNCYEANADNPKTWSDIGNFGLVLFFWVVVCIFYQPNELFLGNVKEFVYPYSTCLIITTLLAGLTALSYLILGFIFLDRTGLNLLKLAILIYSVCSYVQVLFLNGRMMLLDGSDETWTVLKMVLNILIWMLIACLFIYLYKRDKEKTIKVGGIVGALVACVQLATIITLIISGHAFEYNDTPIALTNEKEFELNTKNNVVFFVLDWFDTQIFDKVAENDSEMMEPLADFTYYNNMTSNYVYTEMELPFLLTGVEWTKEHEGDYTRYAFMNSTYISDISKKGYKVGIYTYPYYVDYSCDKYIENMKVNNVSDVDVEHFVQLYRNVSHYKTMPFIVKGLYRYTQGQLNRAAGYEDEFIIWDDITFYQPLIEKGLTVNSNYEGYFKLYHLNGPHIGYNMTEDFQRPDASENGTEHGMLSQAKGSLKIVYEYIRQMKELGIYDDATIIITADHGQNFYAENKEELLESCKLDRPCNPILLIKAPCQKQEEINTNEIALTQKNILATVCEIIGIDTEVYGKSVYSVGDDEINKRTIEFYRNPDVEYRKYVIEGHVKDWSNWSLSEE